MQTAVLLDRTRYLRAIRSAEQKNNLIKYRQLKSDRSIILLYNPATQDGKFSSKLSARTELTNGYYEAWPHIKPATTLAQNLELLHKRGWPEYEVEGV